MLTIQVHKAQPNFKGHVVPDVQITLSGEFPALQPPGEATRQFEEDARALLEALKHLPGGTFTQLLSLMLTERASHFVVAF